jgi:hypothetical protein
VASLGYQRGRHQVYNIEVETEHCYFVGNAKALTHNMCQTEAERLQAKQDAGDTREGVTYMDPKDIEKSHPMMLVGALATRDMELSEI